MTPKQAQNRRDYVDNKIYELFISLSPIYDTSYWNIEAIGNVRDAVQDAVCSTLNLMTEEEFYPTLREEDDVPD